MSIAWLRDLEERVEEASERLRTLRQEKAELEKRIEELEAELAEAAAPNPDAQAWEQERTEVQSRVADLVGHLEALLED